jgi:ABC-type lipoprotein release transport system permease subunit
MSRVGGPLEIAVVWVSRLDPVTYVSVLMVLAAPSALASYLPALLAAAVNPVEALRAE